MADVGSRIPTTGERVCCLGWKKVLIWNGEYMLACERRQITIEGRERKDLVLYFLRT